MRFLESVAKRFRELSKHLSDSDVAFLKQINSFALLPINFEQPNFNGNWISERIAEQKNNALWKNLSRDKSSAKHFRIDSMDPTEGIFFVSTDFLIRKAGNKTGGLGKEDPIRDAFDKGVKLPTPQYWLRDGELGEGNHRVMVAKEKGYKSVPVRVYWK